MVKAYSVVRDVFNIRAHWQLIETLDNQIDATTQLEMELRLREDIIQSMYWVIQQFGENFTVTDLTEQLGQGVALLAANLAQQTPKPAVLSRIPANLHWVTL